MACRATAFGARADAPIPMRSNREGKSRSKRSLQSQERQASSRVAIRISLNARRHQLAHAGSIDERVDARRGGIESFFGISLSDKRAVQLDLKNVRKLRVNRRDRTRCCAFDRSSCLIEWNRKRRSQTCAVV